MDCASQTFKLINFSSGIKEFTGQTKKPALPTDGTNVTQSNETFKLTFLCHIWHKDLIRWLHLKSM